MQPTIRRATAADHQHLEVLQRRASLATGEHHQDLLDNPDVFGIAPENIAHTLVAELDGENRRVLHDVAEICGGC